LLRASSLFGSTRVVSTAIAEDHRDQRQGGVILGAPRAYGG
jgi:hypothetical protein